MTTKEMIAYLEQAQRANYQDSARQGNLIRLEGPGDVVMTGDLHGHEENFKKLVRYANLGEHSNRHLILHELIHRSGSSVFQQCHSYHLVAEAAKLKAKFPDQVHYLLGNHAIAQVTRDEVLKNGQAMVRALNAGLFETFGSSSQMVSSALDEFILSLGLAVRTDNGIWMSHTLPSPRHIADFDDAIFTKPLTIEDLKSNKSLRALTWDRTHDAQGLEQLRNRWKVKSFIVGHKPQENGWHVPFEDMIILASDHQHGCFLHFDLGHDYAPGELAERIRPLAGIR